MATRGAPKAVASAASAAARAVPSSGPLGLDAASAGRLNAERMAIAQKFLVLRTASVSLDAATGSLLPAPAPAAPPASSFGAPVPANAPRAERGGAPQFRKRLRLHAHWRLQPTRRWVDFGPFISAISITYDPALEGSVGARELARQVQSEKARSRFSKIDIVVKESDDGQPGVVQVKWINDKTSFAPAQFHTFEEILEYFEVPRMTLMREQEDAEML